MNYSKRYKLITIKITVIIILISIMFILLNNNNNEQNIAGKGYVADLSKIGAYLPAELWGDFQCNSGPYGDDDWYFTSGFCTDYYDSFYEDRFQVETDSDPEATTGPQLYHIIEDWWSQLNYPTRACWQYLPVAVEGTDPPENGMGGCKNDFGETYDCVNGFTLYDLEIVAEVSDTYKNDILNNAGGGHACVDSPERSCGDNIDGDGDGDKDCEDSDCEGLVCNYEFICLGGDCVVEPDYDEELEDCLEEYVYGCTTDSECISLANLHCGHLLEDGCSFGAMGIICDDEDEGNNQGSDSDEDSNQGSDSDEEFCEQEENDGDKCGLYSGSECLNGICIETICDDGLDNDMITDEEGHYYIENNYYFSLNQDGADCADPDCELKRCGDKNRCENNECVESVYDAPSIRTFKKNIENKIKTFEDFLQNLNKGVVITSEDESCDSSCKTQGKTCIFAQAGLKTCSEIDSAICTCY